MAHKIEQASYSHDDPAAPVALADPTSTTTGHRTSRQVELRAAGDIKPEAVLWPWDQRVPLGRVTLSVGQPALGKTTVALDLTARWSQGQVEGDFMGTPVAVAYATAEDSPAHTIVPRLMAAGADLRRVHLVEVSDGGAGTGLVLPDDLDKLADRLREVGARVLVLDPVVAHLAGAIDSHREADVRRVLAPLARLADNQGLAVIGIMHLNKSISSDVLTRVSGSVGFGAAARSVLCSGIDPDDEDSRILALVKSNLGRDDVPALRYRMQSATVHGEENDEEVVTAKVLWLGEVAGISGHELLRAPESGGERSALAEAEDFLRSVLSVGPVPAKEVRAEAEEAGIAHRTLDRAKRSLDVRSAKQGQPGEAGQIWMWEMPEGRQIPRSTPSLETGDLRSDLRRTSAEATLQASADTNGSREIPEPIERHFPGAVVEPEQSR